MSRSNKNNGHKHLTTAVVTNLGNTHRDEQVQGGTSVEPKHVNPQEWDERHGRG